MLNGVFFNRRKNCGPKKIVKIRSNMFKVMMAGGDNSEISYRVKCFVVENEKIFGDFVVTSQTRDQLCSLSALNYGNFPRRNISNLRKQVLEIPDLMALNSKPVYDKRNTNATKISSLINKRKNLVGKNVSSINEANSNGKNRTIEVEKKQKSYPLPMPRKSTGQEVMVTSLVDQLLLDIYGYPRNGKARSESDSTASSYKPPPQHRYLRRARLLRKTEEELTIVLETLRQHVNYAGGLLIRQLRRRDYLRAKRDKQYDVITAHLQAYSAKRSEDTRMRFSLTPQPGESGFTQWLDAMKMVARLPGGIPQEFRKRLWLTLAERHLDQRGVDWKQAEKLCFNEWSNPDDEELGIQIVKDLHRTGCSLFCGAAGRDNQAVLRRVLLGFARWNKSVGYCQGLNVLAALVLQVTDRAESSAVKVMIHLIEGVLPEGYFADNLRGLSIDMAVFRDLLKMRLPKLSRHLEALQNDAKDKATGSSYEPPLTNVFTMQWFLTLFCHCLPQEAVLRVWDLIFLEGDEVLLRTALAIWEGISDRIMTVTSADEFYSIMGVLTREMLEFTDVNNLIKTIVNMGPLDGVTNLREKHRYNITPWARRLSDEEDTDTEEEERLAVAAAMFGVSQRFKKDRSNASSALQTIGPTSDRERLALDISTLKHQYAKLRERQRQAHIILSAACARQSMVPSSTSQAMNHLLVGKSALVSAKTRQLGPPPGTIPPKPRSTATLHPTRIQTGRRDKHGVTLHWKDTKKSKDEQNAADEAETSSGLVDKSEVMSSALTSPKRGSATDSDSDSTSTELCDEPDRLSDVDSEEPTSTSDCYVMATDDEKSPRPGTSPTPGIPPLRQYTETNSSLQRVTAYLDVTSHENDVKSNCRQSLDVDDASSSIAMITDQIRRLSASDDNNLSPIHHVESAKLQKNDSETQVSPEKDKPICRSKEFGEIGTNFEEQVASSSTNPEITGALEYDDRVSETNFQTLDRYDFLIRKDKFGSSDEVINPAVSLADKYDEVTVQNVSNFETDDTSSSVLAASDFGTIHPTVTIESTQLNDIPGGNEEIFSYESTLINHSTATSVSTDPMDLHFSKYRDSVSTMISPEIDQSKMITSEQTFPSRSYVIGHLPISPATVNEKLNRASELSPVIDNIRILSTDIDKFDFDTKENVDKNREPVAKNGTMISELTDSPMSFTKNLALKNDIETSSKYKVAGSVESILTSTMTRSMDKRVPDGSELFDTIPTSKENLSFLSNSIDKGTIVSLAPESNIDGSVSSDRSNGISSAMVDNGERSTNDLSIKFDTIVNESLVFDSSERKVHSTDEGKSSPNLSQSVAILNSLKLSSHYAYQDSGSSGIYEDKKKSPKTPDSADFSSGETMGPDSKNSSMATSPRSLTTRSDSRNLPLDKSERSSLSSESKTLTVHSLDSESGINDRRKLDTKSDATRPSFDKSSPSTPISTDSLKNKSEISPKFVISSSSESCTPEKANKSSERSFSSELQSPVSANSIKYRTNYVDGQDNLSETSMDICSATSPFYPIVNPNQKTPSPYGTTGKLKINGTSEETSPEQKSTSSKDTINSSAYDVSGASFSVTKSIEVGKSLKDKDEYDSGRPFEKELAETLSSLPCDRTKNERASISRYKEDFDLTSYRTKKTTIEEVEETEERYVETDTVSPLRREKYDTKRSAFVGKEAAFKGLGMSNRDEKSWITAKEPLKPFERSCSSLEKRFGQFKASPSSDEFVVNTHKKRSSDILQDLKHLEAKTLADGKADTSMLTRKTGYVWEDLQNLEARRQDNFSDSASEFSRGRLDPPRINVFTEPRKSYVVEPKINLEECSDSILKSYARKKSNGEPDDDRESKLGVWTKVKPRAGRDNGRRSSDRALKIIQENSAILHKILTCQAKKRLPDLEEISKEITISPINEEISKIFSPILEKMGLNEHEINEELARINFKDFDQMTTASGSEFDAKINDELSKLSLIDDTEIVNPMDVEDVASNDYLVTRDALIDRQINEELSKLLANYEQDSPVCTTGNREVVSSLHNASEMEGLDISSISTNVFSYQSSNDSIEMKNESDSVQDTPIGAENFSQYSEDPISKFVKPSQYNLRGISPRSDIDIYRELEKLDKISSGEMLPSASSIVPQKIITPIAYPSECPVFPEVRPAPEYSVKSEKSFELSPVKSPYDTYKPYDFKARISPRKTPSNPYSARCYDKTVMNDNFDFDDSLTSPTRHYELGSSSRPILSKETLEFRVRYDDEASKTMRNDDLTLEPYQSSLVNFDRGVSYYSDEPAVPLKRIEIEKNLDETIVSPLGCAYNQSDLYGRKYDSVTPTNYSYVKNTSDYEKSYKVDADSVEAGSYLSVVTKNSHSLSPNYQYDEREYTSMNDPYNSGFQQTLNNTSEALAARSEFPEKMSQLVKYADTTTSREALNFRKASLTLGPLDGTTSRIPKCHEKTPSPRSLFSPFPVRNSSRKPKELALKLGLYSPSSPGSTSLKRS